jgi:hypothetical protein
MIRDETIELFPRELGTAVGKLVNRPAANRVHPVASRNRLRACRKQIERLLARFDAVKPHFVGPRRAGAQQVHVVVDEPGNNRPSPQIDAARRGAGHLCDLLIGADSDDPVAFDGDSLGDGEFVINGDDLSVGENQVGGRLLRVKDCAKRQSCRRGREDSPHVRSL